jgi:hypothetical protein
MLNYPLESISMQHFSIRPFKVVGRFVLGLVIVVGVGGMLAVGQTGPGWVALFDGKTIGDGWDRVGDSNWRVEDGAIVADRHTGELPAFLVTKAKYKDYRLTLSSGPATTRTAA